MFTKLKAGAMTSPNQRGINVCFLLDPTLAKSFLASAVGAMESCAVPP